MTKKQSIVGGAKLKDENNQTDSRPSAADVKNIQQINGVSSKNDLYGQILCGSLEIQRPVCFCGKNAATVLKKPVMDTGRKHRQREFVILDKNVQQIGLFHFLPQSVWLTRLRQWPEKGFSDRSMR
ncbi:MAG: hypothetical protein VB032_05130 [Burkholderiaceae bacterium]|nr:hypothetical protein [Burkholderiaceae bacterium]